MKLRILLVCIAAVAAPPSSAFAVNSPELTFPTGTKLATETKVQAANVGEPKLTWGATTITCSSSKLKGSLTKNTGSELEAEIDSATFNGGGQCSTGGAHGATVTTAPEENGVPWCLRSTPELTEDEFQVKGGKCSEGIQPIRLEVNTTVTVTVEECVYERSSAVTGTYQTHPGDAVLTSNKVTYTRVSGLIFCPATMELDTSFTLQKEEGSAGPVYISAGPRLTFPTGTTLASASKLKATNIGGIKMTTGLGTTECSGAEMTGTLKKNSGTEIEADIESASITGGEAGGACKFPTGNVTWTFKPATNGLPWCLRATSGMAADQFQIRGNSCASASRPIRILWEQIATGPEKCVYERSAALGGTFTTHPEGAVLNFKHANFLEVAPKSASCPDEAQLDSSMTLEQEAEGKPLYIS
jgi:hypothetical protein